MAPHDPEFVLGWGLIAISFSIVVVFTATYGTATGWFSKKMRRANKLRKQDETEMALRCLPDPGDD